MIFADFALFKYKNANKQNNLSYIAIKNDYKIRREQELYSIMKDPEKWKEFQDILRSSNCGVTNSSVRENLLTTLRTKYKNYNPDESTSSSNSQSIIVPKSINGCHARKPSLESISISSYDDHSNTLSDDSEYSKFKFTL